MQGAGWRRAQRRHGSVRRSAWCCSLRPSSASRTTIGPRCTECGEEPRVHARGVTWEPRFYVALGPKPGEPGQPKYPPQPQLPAANVGTAYCYTGMQYRPARGLWLGPSASGPSAWAGAEVFSWGHSSQSIWANVRHPTAAGYLQRDVRAGLASEPGRFTVDGAVLRWTCAAGTERVEVSYFPCRSPGPYGSRRSAAPRRSGSRMARKKRPIRPKASAVALVSLALLAVGVSAPTPPSSTTRDNERPPEARIDSPTVRPAR